MPERNIATLFASSYISIGAFQYDLAENEESIIMKKSVLISNIILLFWYFLAMIGIKIVDKYCIYCALLPIDASSGESLNTSSIASIFLLKESITFLFEAII